MSKKSYFKNKKFNLDFQLWVPAATPAKQFTSLDIDKNPSVSCGTCFQGVLPNMFFVKIPDLVSRTTAAPIKKLTAHYNSNLCVRFNLSLKMPHNVSKLGLTII